MKVNKSLFEETYPQNDRVTQMKYDVLKNIPIVWKNKEGININDLMEKRLEVQRWTNVYPNGLDGVNNELKSVNRFVISELKKQLNDRGLVMVDVELIGSHKDWRSTNQSEDSFKRFVCFIPKIVCGSKEDITFFICTLFKELKWDLDEDYKGYHYVQYLDWLKDVKIEIKNPLQSEELKPLFGTNKFIWLYPNQMETMKDFSSTKYRDLYDDRFSDDKEYMKQISERDKMLSGDYRHWSGMVRDYNSNDEYSSSSQKQFNVWLKDEMNIEVEEVEE